MAKKKEHKIVSKTWEYRPDDFILYRNECSCGKVCGAWTVKEVEKEFDKHVKEADDEKTTKENN